MMDWSKRTLGVGAVLALALGLSACEGATSAPHAPMTDQEVRAQALGESTETVWFSGDGAGAIPTYPERVGIFFFNLARMTPHEHGLVDMMGNPILPNSPSIYQPYMAETGRWQAKHAAETACDCSAEAIGYNPMDPATEGLEKFVNATCCDLSTKDGVASCAGPLVPCTNERATLRTERWAELNRGIGQIVGEQIFPVGGLLTSTQMAGVFYPPGGMGTIGTPLQGNARTFGIAQFETEVLPPNCLDDPDQDVCQPGMIPIAARIALLTGTTIDLPPIFTNGIHLPTNPDAGTTQFGVHYFDLSGDPQGEARKVELVLGGTCTEMTRRPIGTMLPNGQPAPYVGNTYISDQTLTSAGCQRYVFVGINGDGLEYVYPSYGSLGIQTDAMGVVVDNDASCPIWESQRPDISCVTAGDECTDGDTRACYTGRPGTQEEGQCKLGTETCGQGRWTGTCAGEVRPDGAETCGDNIDNDCNGGVDETCGTTPNPMMDMGTPDMGEMDMTSNPDMGEEMDMTVVVTPPMEDDDPGNCGCRHVRASIPTPFGLLLLGLLFGVRLSRSPRRRD